MKNKAEHEEREGCTKCTKKSLESSGTMNTKMGTKDTKNGFDSVMKTVRAYMILQSLLLRALRASFVCFVPCFAFPSFLIDICVHPRSSVVKPLLP